jgi:hypothetical protein
MLKKQNSLENTSFAVETNQLHFLLESFCITEFCVPAVLNFTYTLGFRGGKPPLILVARSARTNVADYVRERFR